MVWEICCTHLFLDVIYLEPDQADCCLQDGEESTYKQLWRDLTKMSWIEKKNNQIDQTGLIKFLTSLLMLL